MAEVEGRLVGMKHACFLRGVITRQESMAIVLRNFRAGVWIIPTIQASISAILASRFELQVAFQSYLSSLAQSRSQSMPVRGLVVGMALAKPNAICNFIGCRKINETDINGNARFQRELCVGSWIMRNDVNKKMTWNHS